MQKTPMDSQRKVHCDPCNITYKSHHSLLRHNDQIHSDNPTYRCSHCSKRLGGKSELENHMQTHDTANFFKAVCSICGTKYKTNESLKHHIKRSHSKEDMHQCSKCSKTFRYPNELRKHQQSAHETKSLEEYFACGDCPKKLKTKRCLDLHKMMHSGEKPYKCGFCEGEFRQAAHKRTHERNVHGAPGGKTVKCNHCEKTFNDTGHKKTHELSHINEYIKMIFSQWMSVRLKSPQD